MVTMYSLYINQPRLPIPFTLFLCLFLSLWPFQLYFIPSILPTTLHFLGLFVVVVVAVVVAVFFFFYPGLIPTLLVLSAHIYL